MTSRELEYWSPEPLFKGETIFCLASGPSLTADICARIRGRRTIAINSSAVLAPWASVLFFTDSSWYEARRDLVANWCGLVISMSRTAKRELPDKVKRVQGEGDPQALPGFSRGPHVIQQGRSSGHTAVSLAIALGASRVVLLGYDMRFVAGREHCHDEYKGSARDAEIYSREFVPGFAGWDEAARAVGVEVVNATEGSAVKEFRFAPLDDVLR
ncbi:hypothetical protein PMI42_04863 [Bradyrhizobium sp. YR681]|uniref:hypothetical protein n=1 Tax=Bradyrhizobium sp. YR681 TaxID=1144344 RepID=UPI0002710D44|nr:hypothetical protein [Bradyrhizobium sp. YR681]EJN11848.1 hypothetical protein PMI42_04863 [Bradyrhizobium sp. YR681]